ncbi:MAG: hypothetical protein H0U60_09810 [Blastocatellia bacterium]|nr:hypothetical protein [Blastocatellia bacterium]
MNWLTKIVSTTLVVVTGCVIALALTFYFMIATTLGKELDPITLGSMLAFSAAFAGVGYKQFKAKRETEWAEDEDGTAYRPGTRITRDIHPSERYNAGIKNPADFSDVNVIDKPVSQENTRIVPPKSESKIEEEEWPEEGA